jgi:hypothetical protein
LAAILKKQVTDKEEVIRLKDEIIVLKDEKIKILEQRLAEVVKGF